MGDINMENGWPERTQAASEHIDKVVSRLNDKGKHEHGGAYYDDNSLDVLHINALQGKDDIINSVDSKIIKVHRVTYNCEDLERAQEAVKELMGRYTIVNSAQDVVNNRVNVGVVDHDPENLMAIRKELTKLGVNVEEMICFIPTDDPDELYWGTGESSELGEHEEDMTEVVDKDGIYLRPGEWIGVKGKHDKVVSCRSFCFAAQYKGKTYFTTAGHMWTSLKPGRTVYHCGATSENDEYVQRSNYPNTKAGQKEYDAARNKIGDGKHSQKVGIFHAAKCEGEVDFCSIERTAGHMIQMAYNNRAIKYIGGEPIPGDIVYFTGVSNRNPASSGIHFKCDSVHVHYKSLDGTTITNGISVIGTGHTGIGGTSGGPLMHLRKGTDDGLTLVGMASKPDGPKDKRLFFTKVHRLLELYKLDPINLTRV